LKDIYDGEGGGVKMVYREGRGLEWCMGGEVV